MGEAGSRRTTTSPGLSDDADRAAEHEPQLAFEVDAVGLEELGWQLVVGAVQDAVDGHGVDLSETRPSAADATCRRRRSGLRGRSAWSSRPAVRPQLRFQPAQSSADMSVDDAGQVVKDREHASPSRLRRKGPGRGAEVSRLRRVPSGRTPWKARIANFRSCVGSWVRSIAWTATSRSTFSNRAAR